jgi:hypothetical protein
MNICFYQFGALLLLAASSATHATPPEIVIQNEISNWQRVVEFTKQDTVLLDQVEGNFYTAAKLSGPTTSFASVNATLEPLRSRFGEFRRVYHNASDYCPIRRKLSDMRSIISNRQREALGKQKEFLQLKIILLRQRLILDIGKILGEKVTRDELETTFTESIEPSKFEDIKPNYFDSDMDNESDANEEEC